MDKTMRTAAGATLQTALKWDLPYEILPNSTLNQKFGIASNIAPEHTRDLAVRYMTIGIGGTNIEVGANGRKMLTTAFRQPSHASLYDHIPFIVRPIEEDLPAEQRNRYRLRAVLNIRGKQYVAYYARVLPKVTVPVSLELRTQENSIVTTVPWSFPPEALHPTPPLLSNNQTMVTSDDSLASTCILDIIFDENDTQELLNVAYVLFGNEAYAVITEIGLCSGADKVISGDFNGFTTTYTEAVAVQISDIISVNFPAVFNVKGTKYSVDVGATEPLLITVAADSIGGVL